MMRLIALLAITAICPLIVLAKADVVETRDGARLVGTITSLADGVLTLETSYAGTLKINAAEIATFTSGNPLFLRLESGDTLSGVVQSAGPDSIRVRNEETALAASTGRVVSAWLPGQPDPAVAARERELLALQRKWSYQLAVSLTGRGGNSEELGVGLRGNASLDGPDDNLRIYGRYNLNKTDGVTTADQKIGGIRYDSFLYEGLGWYTRVELENDRFRNLDLRTTAGAGLSYRFLNEDHHRLVGRLGGAYRYQSFSDGTNSNEPAIDLGLTHAYTSNGYWRLNSEVSLNPSVENLSEFILNHTSVLEIPLPDRFWSLGLGITNDYDNKPTPGVKSWDYTWFAALILNFD